jgi:hypothetical protein
LISGQAAHQGRGAADRGEYREAAGKIKNPKAPAVKREAEEDWRR